MVRRIAIFSACLAAGVVFGGCPIFLPPNCGPGFVCPAGEVCGSDQYCHASGLLRPDGGGSTGGSSGSAASNASTSTGTSTGASSGTTSTSSGSASSGTSGSSSGGSSSGATCVPLGPTSGGLTPRSGLAAVFVDGLIFAVGGLDSCFNPTDLIEVYDTTSPLSGWQDSSTTSGVGFAPRLPPLGGAALISAVGINPATPGNALGTAAWGLVVIGGKNGSGFSNLAEALRQGGATWHGDEPLAAAVDEAAAVVDANGCIELIGGLIINGGNLAGTATDQIQTLCSAFPGAGGYKDWTTSSLTLPVALDGEAAAQDSLGNSYVLGGVVPGEEVSNTALVIDPSFSTVTSLPDTDSGHFAGGAAVSGSKLYAIGGQDFAIAPAKSTVEVLDFTSSASWGSASSLNVARVAFGTVSDGSGNIYVIGGLDGSGTTLGSVEVLNSGCDELDADALNQPPIPIIDKSLPCTRGSKKLWPSSLRASAPRISRSSRAVGTPSASRWARGTRSAPPRQACSSPRVETRSRLQLEQKLWVRAPMKPTLTANPLSIFRGTAAGGTANVALQGDAVLREVGR